MRQKNIQMFPDGTLKDLNRERLLDPDSVVSMNFWGFVPSVFPVLKTYFDTFLKALPARECKAECLLPVMVDDLLRAGEMKVSVLPSTGQWFGMTYQADRPIVSECLKRLHEDGIYPESFRE